LRDINGVERETSSLCSGVVARNAVAIERGAIGVRGWKAGLKTWLYGLVASKS
jgi:hypothetical protein